MNTPTPTSSTRLQTVVITGASSGIGRETALLFAAQGARLTLAARGVDRLDDTARDCVSAGAADVLVQPTDIAARDEVDALLATAIDRHGPIDIVVQNASVAAFGQFEQIPADVFDAVIGVDVLGAANVCRSALHHFRQVGGGRLIVVGSVLGQAAVPLMSPYVMSKFAVTALVRILRQETRSERGIHVNAIWPGAIDTPIYGLSANYFGRAARVLPVKDTPDKIARAIVAAAQSGKSGAKQVGLLNVPMLLSSRLMPRLFDAMTVPLMRALSFKKESLEPTSGNVLADQVTTRK